MTAKRAKTTVLLLVIVPIFISFLILSSTVKCAVVDAMRLCFSSVIPSLFPFLVLTKLILAMDINFLPQKPFSKISKALFSVSHHSFSALLLGIVSGYPIGASLCVSLYKNGTICRREAERLLAFSNNAGPAFILSAIGIGIFSSLQIGTILLLIHIFSAIFVGIFLKVFFPISTVNKNFKKAHQSKAFSFAFTDAVCGALSASLMICAYVVFFTVLMRVFSQFSASLPGTLSAFLGGILEITSGSFAISGTATPEISFVLISFLLGFGGMCVHFQALSFIGETDLRTHEYFFGKLLQGFLSAIIAFLITKSHFFDDVSVFASEPSLPQNAHFSYTIPLLIILFCVFLKKGWKKQKI